MMKCRMSKIETDDVMDGPVVSGGGRSPSTLSSGHAGVGQGALAPGHRWSVGRKREVVLRVIASGRKNYLFMGSEGGNIWVACYEPVHPLVASSRKVSGDATQAGSAPSVFSPGG
jgi:hypothetical protein